MTVRLRDDPDALNVLVSRAALHEGVNPAYVGKDFWVTEVLRVAPQPRGRDGGRRGAPFRRDLDGFEAALRTLANNVRR